MLNLIAQVVILLLLTFSWKYFKLFHKYFINFDLFGLIRTLSGPIWSELVGPHLNLLALDVKMLHFSYSGNSKDAPYDSEENVDVIHNCLHQPKIGSDRMKDVRPHSRTGTGQVQVNDISNILVFS